MGIENISSKYDPSLVEDRWYANWIEKKYFHSCVDKTKEAYTVVIPPPNVTGILHMGHMLNNTIQDVLLRRARQKGLNACWVPGTDHASIATEAKVVSWLKEQGIDKKDISREEFLKYAWQWKEKYGGIILKQLRKLGASCDWDRTKFTMDPDCYEAVIDIFIRLYEEGLIYKGLRMVNWDCKALTAISDEEVIYKEVNSKLYYLRYEVVGAEPGAAAGSAMGCSEGGSASVSASSAAASGACGLTASASGSELPKYVIVATTRPETILGDVAVCVNPTDPRYQALHGKKLRVPIVGREIPVITDEYVDKEFGTGCLKITPAHDINDYEIGLKYKLDVIDIFTPEGKIREGIGLYEGMDRFELREKIVQDLKSASLLEKEENYTNKVGYSERTNVVIEPKISAQWFLKMQSLAKPALEVVENDQIEFHPIKFKNTYRHWMENIKDWCISRQLWWGQRIPAYYLPNKEVVVAKSAQEALSKAKEKYPEAQNYTLNDLKQDEDVLDTWFSSWLWPMSVFDGIRKPNNEEIEYYYPTSDLVTAPDIMFFWVARMIMAGLHIRHKIPFSHVYYTGTVRDKLGRKMSKSLGNSPDPIDLIEKFGADGVRLGMLLTSPAGNDLPFDEAICEQGRNFCNKIWNALRLIKSWKVEEKPCAEASTMANTWFLAKLKETKLFVEDNFSKYRLSDALMAIYKLIWDDFCAWYLEIIKPAYGDSIDRQTYTAACGFFDELMKLLHPFMPFITEEVWHNLAEGREDETIMFESLETKALDAEEEEVLKAFEHSREIVMGIRAIRNSKNIPPKKALDLGIRCEKGESLDESWNSVISKLANLESIAPCTEAVENASSFVLGTREFYVIMNKEDIDPKIEIAKAKEELEYTKGFLISVKKKLDNPKFVDGAPQKVVDMERKKLSDAMDKISVLEQRISQWEKAL